jgi:hypothetical protein
MRLRLYTHNFVTIVPSRSFVWLSVMIVAKNTVISKNSYCAGVPEAFDFQACVCYL